MPVPYKTRLLCCLLLTNTRRINAACFIQPTTPSSRKLFAIEPQGEDDAPNPHRVISPTVSSQSSEIISTAKTSASSSIFEDALFLERFKRRRDEASSKIKSERSRRPPSNSTYFISDPKNVITSILDGLLRPHDPVQYFGYEILYASSTAHWKDVLRKSVGAPIGTEEELIFRALSTSMERPNNQFGIMVGLGTDDDDHQGSYNNAKNKNSAGCEKEEVDGYYTIEFPWDTLDYLDGTAWVECRLRDKQSDLLLVVLGWSMEQRDSDGSWLIDGIDWQDFREKYRPGIGREEWERICG
mmetsp:Transcript_38733/g.71307  ORF Transcript_38733/g.71307 Transcript_38733/m.71307 type:complete len:299 (+) Transcript_38733:36-932(+)